MHDFFEGAWQELASRASGPMKFRLVLQPLVATALAVRAGLRDGHEGRSPFLWSAAFEPEARRELLRSGWKDVGKVLILAATLDVAYQLIVLGTVGVLDAIGVAVLLAFVPYVLVRGPVTRLVRRRSRAPPTDPVPRW